ncbi:MAG TPA: hypothetical protein VF533_16945 [Solirubrobacteraceae bacterium]
MADFRDLLPGWQEAIRQLRGGAAAITGPGAELVRPLVEPLQHQAELLEEAVRAQVDFQKQLAGRLLAPYNVAVDALEQTSSAMRAQSAAFEAAAASFTQASRLLSVQAGLVDTAARSLRDPIEFLKSAAPRPPRDDDD